MSNIFKGNSRFDCLIEKSEKCEKSDKKSNVKVSNVKTIDTKDTKVEKSNTTNAFRYTDKKLEKETEERKKQEESLKIEYFPELVPTKKNADVEVATNVQQNYIDKLKTLHVNNSNEYKDPDIVNLEPGWVFMKKDKLTGNIVIKRKEDKQKKTNVILDDSIIGNKIMNACNKLHEERTQEYIDLNGYDLWEKNFKFPNWIEWEALYEDELDDSDDDSDDENEEEDNYEDHDFYNDY